MCLSFEAQTEKEPVLAVDFNCIRMGTQGVALLKPEDGGGLVPPLPQDSPPVVASAVSTTTGTPIEVEEEEDETTIAS